jgi:hypothetical protein
MEFHKIGDSTYVGGEFKAIEFSTPIKVEEIKAGDGDWEVSGYVSIFGNLDDGNDIVLPGAFANTLKSGRKVRFLFDHDTGKVLGPTKKLKEDTKGLFGNFKISKTRLGEEAHQLLLDGAIDSFSYGYQATDFENKKDGVRELKAIELYEASLVSIPMNSLAVVTGFKSLTDRVIGINAEMEQFLNELRGLTESIDKPLTETKRNELKKLLELCAGMDAVRSDLSKVLVTAPVSLVEQHQAIHQLAEARKRLAHILQE